MYIKLFEIYYTYKSVVVILIQYNNLDRKQCVIYIEPGNVALISIHFYFNLTLSRPIYQPHLIICNISIIIAVIKFLVLV